MSDAIQSFLTTQKQFSDNIRDPENSPPISGIEARRLKIYQELFFNNVEGFASGAFPVLKELLSEKDWLFLVREFFHTHQCETPYFLEISEEFLSFLAEAEYEFLPEFSYQLAHWEWMELHADIAPTQDVAEPIEFIQLHSVLTTVDCAWCQAYEYPVHKISSECLPQEQTPSFLMVYRDQDLSVGFNELNPLSFILFEQLQKNESSSLQDILKAIAQAHGMDENMVLNGGLEIIEQWGAVGVLKPIPN
jgi:hypothetical protein